MTPTTAEWAWRAANILAIAASLGSCVASYLQASAKVAGLAGLFSFLAICTTYVAGAVRDRASQVELKSSRSEIERLRVRTARRNLTNNERAALITAAREEGPKQVWIPHVASDQEASEYAKQLRDAFSEAGWITGYAGLHVGTPIYGLVVGMSPPFNSSADPSEIERVRRVLASAGLTSTVTGTFPSQSPAFGWSPPPRPGANAAVLLVASKSSA